MPTDTITAKVTKIYTVTSCPAAVTDCPVGKVTTEVATSTLCPGCNSNKPGVDKPAPGKPSSPDSKNTDVPVSATMSCNKDDCATAPADVVKIEVPTAAHSSIATSVVSSVSTIGSIGTIGTGGAHHTGAPNPSSPATAGSGKPLSNMVALVAGLLVTGLLL